MHYAPQGWLADFSAMTDEIVRSNESMDIDELDSFQDQSEVDGLVAEIMHRKRKYKPRQVVCQDCGEIFTGAGSVLKYCPKCKAQRKKIWQDEYQQRHGKRAKAKEVAMQEKPRNTAPVETVLVNRCVEAHDVKADDVPVVPSEEGLYYSEADKIKKTAPIETVLVPKKEDNMDAERAERLMTFPSLSNMTEHPEYFTQPTATTYTPADNGTTGDMPDIPAEQVEKMKDALREGFRKDRKSVILSLYSTICDICRDVEITVPEVLDRLTRIDEALS